MSGGIFDGSPIIEGGTDGTIIGNIGDRLKVAVNSLDLSYLDDNKTYSVGIAVNMASSGNDNNIVLFRNTSATKKIYIRSIYIGTNVTNVLAAFKLWAAPTITSNGTAQTSVPRFIGNGAPSAEGIAYSLPTISSRGSFAASWVGGQNSNSSNIIDSNLALSPGSAFLLTGSPSSNNREAVVSISWVES